MKLLLVVLAKVNTLDKYCLVECYSHQKEFIFLWEQYSDINEPKIFDCSPARQYCPIIGTANIMKQLER